MVDQIRIVIADDHPIVRQGLRQTMERESDLTVLAEADDGEAALRLINELKPDVVVMDLDMPVMSGFALLTALREHGISIGTIVLTVHQEKEFFDEAVRLGAQGYILKDSTVTDIVQGIRAVAAGQSYVSPALTSYLLSQARQEQVRPAGISQLTNTERTVLRLVAEYKTNNQIGEELCISPHTVKTHRKNITGKLGLEGNHALMKFALEHKPQL
jgi:DNA-binding NarL/FixJ family response regulator